MRWQMWQKNSPESSDGWCGAPERRRRPAFRQSKPGNLPNRCRAAMQGGRPATGPATACQLPARGRRCPADEGGGLQQRLTGHALKGPSRRSILAPNSARRLPFVVDPLAQLPVPLAEGLDAGHDIALARRRSHVAQCAARWPAAACPAPFRRLQGRWLASQGRAVMSGVPSRTWAACSAPLRPSSRPASRASSHSRAGEPAIADRPGHASGPARSGSAVHALAASATARPRHASGSRRRA